ncbi:MAG TPA: glycosyltransferase family 4 protein [Candidatus Saccharimonadales bacterium]|nr:glycosyltransferase family 4 protein [Candidatus Saccharimonadales bacterium]
MNILWITWKDYGHPEAGGAEVVCHELCKLLIADGHEVTLLTTAYPGAKETTQPGLRVVRVGSSRYVHPFQALLHYIRHARNAYDIVIEEVNGSAPYFAVFFGRRAKRFLLYHQLARRNWPYEIRWPFGHLGYYVLAPLATWLVSLARVPVITVSESTKRDLAQFGLAPKRTHIISEGLHIPPLDDLHKIHKYRRPTILSHGSMRAMKRTLDQIQAFELAKQFLPNLQMKISGSSSGTYGQKVLRYIAGSRYARDIEYLGRTTHEQKIKLMRRCHAILVTSVEEGWGLIVSEANSQGTPAVVYDVNGLRDSVKHAETGIVTDPHPSALATGIATLLTDTHLYATLRHKAWEWSKKLTFEQSYHDLKGILSLQ